VLDDSRVRGTSVLGGAFMDLLASGAIGPDPKTHIYRVWGDPDQPYDFTSTDDYAKYIAAVALDDTAGRFIRVAGDTQSPRGLAAIFEDLRAARVTIDRAGTVADLGQLIEKMQAADPAPGNPFPRWQQMQYTRDMASGKGRLEPLDNARYPAIHPLDIRAFLRRPRAAS
jgi:nucleoside-diphosphate-sugar epimerase